MTAILSWGELTVGVLGLFIVLFAVIFCIRLIAKTAGKLKKTIIYMLIGIIAGGLYITSRLLNFEVILTEGKLINLILVSIVAFFALETAMELNKIVNEIISGKKINKSNSPKNKKIQKPNKNSKVLSKNISGEYLDLTGKKPKFTR